MRLFRLDPYTVLFAFVLYFPCEDFLLKWLPVSELLYSLSRFASEFAVYSLLFVIVTNRVIQGEKLRRTPLDIPLLAFIVIAVFSTIVNRAPFLGAMINLRTLLRYLAVFYVVVNLHLDCNQIKRLLNAIIVIAAIESLIGILQVTSGSISDFWLPRQSELEVSGYKKDFVVLHGGIEQGAVIGTFGHSVSMSLYLLFALCLTVARLAVEKRKSIGLMCGLALIVIGISLTYSRAAVLGTVLVIFLVVFLHRRSLFLLLGFLILTALTTYFALIFWGLGTPTVEYAKAKETRVSPIENFLMMFTSEYAVDTQGSRWWMIKEVGTTLLRSGTLIGFSADEETARKAIVKESQGVLQRVIAYRGFEDVYVVAMLGYYGIVGLGIFCWILYVLLRSARYVLVFGEDHVWKVVGCVGWVLVVVTFLMSFVVRTFEFRPFSFCFWTLMGILMSGFARFKYRGGMPGLSA